MSNPFFVVRREIAMEMGLWGGRVDGVSPGPATFTSVDSNGSLFVVYDIIRQEPDAEWNGSYIVINPGGTGNSSLPTIWRRIADDSGFINSTGAITITSPLPSSAYAQTTMTYELYKTFNPQDWLRAVNSAIRTSYPQRHRLIAFEIPENSDSSFYDWGHLAAELAMTDPVSIPTVTTPNDPGGRTNYWATGTYTVGYNIYNAAGETLVSPTTTVSLSPTQILQFAAITVPEQAIGVRYWCTQDPSGIDLTQLSVGSGVLPDATTDNITPQPGVADRTTFIVPKIQFWGPPSFTRTTPVFNTTAIDLGGLSVKTIKRRLNPGQYPERYIDMNPNWWREQGGTSIEVKNHQGGNYALRFDCMAPVRTLVGEADATEEPLELLIAGGMYYLWNLMAMTGSSQNVTIWTTEAKIAEIKFTKARNLYQMPGPRKTMRVPFISVGRWLGG